MPSNDPHHAEHASDSGIGRWSPETADARFTWDLVRAVAQVLAEHGYPPLTARDVDRLVQLRTGLWQLLHTGHAPVAGRPAPDTSTGRPSRRRAPAREDGRHVDR